MNTILLILLVATLVGGGIWVFRLIGDKRRLEESLRDRGARLLEGEAAVTEAKKALDANEARRVALLDTVLDCVISIDHTGRITEFNGMAEKTFGYPPSQLTGRPLADLLIPTVFGKIDSRGLVDYFLADNGAMLGKRQEMTGVRANGAEFPIELVLTRVRGTEPPQLLGYFREITERIKGETAMFERASMAALNVEINRALAGTDGLRPTLQRCAEALIWQIGVAQVHLWTLDEAGTNLEMKGAYGLDSTIDGRSARVPLQTSYLGRLATSGAPTLTNAVDIDVFPVTQREWLAQERITSFAAHPMQVDGRVVGLLALYDSKPLPDGLLTNLSSVAESITQFTVRSRAEGRVREQAALLDEATDAIMVRDLTGQIHFWSRGAEKIFGWTSAEVVGRNANQLLVESGTPATPTALAITLAQGKWSGEFLLRAKDGREIILETRWTLMRNEQGKPKSILAIATDVSEKKQLERKFLRTQRLEVIGTMAGGIAHDLNNVLGPIMIVSQLLRKRLTDDKSIGWLTLMQSNALRGASMVKQILAFARGVAGEQGALQLHHLIADIDRMAQETFPSYIKLEVDAPRTLWPIQGDATQLHQVLLNLCVNARDAMPHGGILKIEARNLTLGEEELRVHPDWKPGRYVVVSVSDTGTGIAPDLVGNIFEPFFTTKDPGQGTGLGLSTVKSIVKGHHGFIDFETAVGKGTTFTIYFPIAEATEAITPMSWPAEMLAGGGEQILLVDDELAIRELAKATLEDFGYKVITGNDGAEAVALFAQHRGQIDAAVIDMAMPVMDGPSAIHVLRKIDPALRLVIVSGSAVGEQVFNLEKTPNTAFLPKPYNVDQLMRSLRKILDGQ
jgi:PAS domain S-box-containing protein